ncbi:minor coat protein [Xanthomonas phage phiLf2]|uniref:Tail virion protein G7P n=6 Tax=root TaxID=1 RepID=G7P_BPPHL|nr:minor coat protein [Xanthomonas phage phiLf2]YP_010768589.1 minor coat protein [Xanthomonas phage phiLF]P68671.1 RecName: Full=Phi-Lf prophage-derived putative minor coat protein [Xanthomonas campestris pv. campestris str. ATCC 33913]P68672.1 RecName: Full=Tail virion protein G7P; AltName: Full=Coat protein C, polypeptide I; AltName: Full=Gene 7 protein; Short=G7P [Xanthomonas phage Lf]AAY49166.1 minor coat protein [Xanthomonas campestris pv. campestris str. 8004]AWY09628.1 minor coat prote
MPSQEDAVAWSTGCCGLVIVWFVLGRLAGSVAGMFNDR